MKLVDTIGMSCPQPLILTKRALREASNGERLRIECDNQTAFNNIVTYLKDQSMNPVIQEEGSVFIIEVDKSESFNVAAPAEAWCNPSALNPEYVIAIRSERMGEGDAELGKILIKGFINALAEQEPLPTHILFYNSGVKLAVRDSGVEETLERLEAEGVRIMVCGTCVDYYDLKDQLGVGMISNMLTITNILASTGHIIYP
ncbi:MAG: sulfurtransferase-like selenium metabolism protein YedF [Bacteroidota bacterium]|nr:sulfurtransferase-like selenium metabolism protein YedF [Bacteroidota bacterium]